MSQIEPDKQKLELGSAYVVEGFLSYAVRAQEIKELLIIATNRKDLVSAAAARRYLSDIEGVIIL